MEDGYDENGMLTARGLADWADDEGGMLYLLIGHGVGLTELQPGLRDDVAEMEQLGRDFDNAVRDFLELHALC